MLIRLRKPGRLRPPPLLSAAECAHLRSLDDAGTQILRRVRDWVWGRAYYAYWRSDAGDEMQLRSCLVPRRRQRVAPDYSGLVLESGGRLPAAPLSVPADRVPEWPRVRDAGKCRWLDLPLGRELLVAVLLRPPGALSTKQLDRLIAASPAWAQETLALYRRFRAADQEADQLGAGTGIIKSPPPGYGGGNVDGARR